MTTLGQAYVQIMPSAKGISGSIQKTINPEATAAGKSAGSRIASSISDSLGKAGKTLTTAITVPALGAATAVSGIVAALGWGRLTGLDSARAKLQGLGYDAAAVERISGLVNQSIQGTVTTMAEGVSIAAGGLAAGVKEGAELERYIKLVGDAAVGANRPVNDMAQIFNRVQGSGRLMTQELNMIEDGMPGFAMAMADSLSVPQAEFRKMVTDGKVSSTQFLDVMESFAGEMSDAYANSWAGMVANTKSNIGIIGESILSGVFQQSKESIADFLAYLRSDNVRAWAKETGQVVGQAFSSMIESVKSAIQWWTNLDGSTQKMIMTIAGIAVTIGPVLMIISKLITAVMTVSKWFGLVKAAAGILGGAIGAISTPVLVIIGVIAGLIAAFTTLYQSNEGFRDLVQTVWSTIKETISTIIQAVSDFVMEIWGGLINWWNENNQMILQAAQNVWNVISTVISTVMNIIWSIMQALWPVIQSLVIGTWNAIKGAIQGAISVITGIIQAFSALFTGNWSALWDAVKQIVSGAVQFVWNWIQISFVGKILKVVKSFAKSFSSVIKDKWETVRLAFMYAIDFVKGLVTRGFGAIRNTVTTIMNAIRSVISNIWKGIRNIISNVVNGIRSTISNIFNSLRGIVSSAFNGVRSAVSNGMTSAFNAVKNFFGRFKDAGKRIVTSIADGIKGAIGKVTDAIGNVTQKVRDFLPFSPPKTGPLTDIMDVEWGETIGGGIEKGENVVQKAMNDLLTFDPPHRSATYASNLENTQDVTGLLTELINAVRENRDVFIDGERVTGRVNEVNAINAMIGGHMD